MPPFSSEHESDILGHPAKDTTESLVDVKKVHITLTHEIAGWEGLTGGGPVYRMNT